MQLFDVLPFFVYNDVSRIRFFSEFYSATYSFTHRLPPIHLGKRTSRITLTALPLGTVVGLGFVYDCRRLVELAPMKYTPSRRVSDTFMIRVTTLRPL